MKITSPLYAVLLLALLTSMLLSPAVSIGAVMLDRVVASVNDEVITWSELMNMILLEGKGFLANISETERQKRISELERPFLNNLIEVRLQQQVARRMGLGVSPQEIDGAILDIKSKFGVTDESLAESLRSEGLSMIDYRSRLADQILMQKVVNYAVRKNIVVSDQEILDYYEKNKEKYAQKEQRKIRQILLKDPDSDGSVDDRARYFVARIRGGEDFTVIAEKFSQGPAKEFGGDLGYITRGMAIQEVEDAAFSLSPGEVSDPFRSEMGLHILMLEDIIAGGGLENVREKIRETLMKEEFEHGYRTWMSQLIENSFVDIK
ncbi:MAG: peptidylprolyl isomerase [Nitrospira sp.]|nr:peptidylprolyl isomerase [Nitrospira sp.]